MLLASETSIQLTNALEKLIDSGIQLGERVLGALIIFIIGKFLVNWLNRLFARILEKRKVDPSIQSFLKSMVNILLLIMLILAVIGKLGIELTGFAALLASAGVAIGMALSGNLQNFAGGLIILLFRPYKVGDFIEASTGASGTVKEIQIFHTILITADNKMIYVPNGAMSSGVITNYSKLDTRRIEWNFGVDYGEDYNKVEKVLREIITNDKRILTSPAPGVAIGMALSGNLQNFAGGLIILLFRPYKVGDFIEASTGASGTVKEIQIFHTILITADNKMIYVPNGAMSSGVITNYSKLDTRRIEWNFGVDYGEDYNKVEKVLREIITNDKRILTSPAPFIELGELAASSVNIKIRVWVNSSDYWNVFFSMNQTVYTIFNKEGINFPFPQLTVHQA